MAVYPHEPSKGTARIRDCESQTLRVSDPGHKSVREPLVGPGFVPCMQGMGKTLVLCAFFPSLKGVWKPNLVEAHHHVNDPDTGSNSGGRQKKSRKDPHHLVILQQLKTMKV